MDKSMKRAGYIRGMNARMVTRLTGIHRHPQRAGKHTLSQNIYDYFLSIVLLFRITLALCLHYLRISAALLTYI